jgi:hypothetical protein
MIFTSHRAETDDREPVTGIFYGMPDLVQPAQYQIFLFMRFHYFYIDI